MEAHIIMEVNGWEESRRILKVFTDKAKADAYQARLNLLLQRARLIYGEDWYNDDTFDEEREAGKLTKTQEKMAEKKAIRQLHVQQIVEFIQESYPIS